MQHAKRRTNDTKAVRAHGVAQTKPSVSQPLKPSSSRGAVSFFFLVGI